MPVISLVEKLKSVTDLFFGIEAAVFAAVCLLSSSGKKSERRYWAYEFAGVFAAAFLGYYLHGFHMNPALNKGLWCALYVIMFSITLGLYLLLMPHIGPASYLTDGETRALEILVPVLLVPTEILLFAGVSWEIYGYALFAIIAAVSLTWKTLRGHRKDRRFILSVILLMFAAVAQGFKFLFSEYAVTAAHVFIIISLAFLFDFALHITQP